MTRPLRPALSLAVMLALAVAAPASADGPSISVVGDGLVAPRGLDFGPNGALYVAEAGNGGDDFCVDNPEAGEICFGLSGGVTRILDGQQDRIIDGLPSLIFGVESGGPSDVSALGNGNLLVSVGLGADPAFRDTLPPGFGDVAGRVLKANPSGSWKVLADISAFEGEHDPDAGQPGTTVDSNPNSVFATPAGAVVADAGGNSLVRTDREGSVSLLAVFDVTFVPAPPFLGLPPGTQIPMQPVPTSVTQGPDGAWYVGLLTGFPFPPGAASVMRVVPGQAPQVYASGFTNVMDVAFGPDGALWVLEIAHNGLLSGDPTGGLWRVPPGGGTPQLVLTDPLAFPGGMTFGPDGALYVSNCAVVACPGHILRIGF